MGQPCKQYMFLQIVHLAMQKHFSKHVGVVGIVLCWFSSSEQDTPPAPSKEPSLSNTNKHFKKYWGIKQKTKDILWAKDCDKSNHGVLCKQTGLG